METIDNIDRIIASELTGEISAEESRILQEWMEADAGNEKLLADIKTYWNCGLKPPYDPDYRIFLTGLKKSQKKRNRYKRFKALSIPAAAIATVGLFILSGLLFTRNGPITPTGDSLGNVFNLDSSYLVLFDGTRYVLDQQDIPQEFYSSKNFNHLQREKPDNNKLIVARKNINSIVLPDGSHVTVNCASWLTFPQEFDEEERRVKLSGEAYFDVVEEESRPFIIELQKSQIMVLGTEFNVKSYDNDISQVTLLSGSVRIISKDHKEEITLRPGEQAVIEDDRISKSTVDSRNSKCWKQGKFYFDDTPLAEIAADLSRWYGIELDMDEDCNGIRVSGTLDRNEPVENVLEIIQKVHPVIFKLKTDGGYFATRRDM